MSIKVNILYPLLQQFTDNQEIVKANGSTVGECLDHLVKQFPGIEKGLMEREISRGWKRVSKLGPRPVAGASRRIWQGQPFFWQAGPRIS